MSPAFAAPPPLFHPSSHLPRSVTARRPSRISMSTPARRVLVAIGNGSEEIETACVVDTLRRAGADVTLASVEPSVSVTMSRGMVFQADHTVSSLSPPFDAVALPGGMPGAQRLADSPHLAKLVTHTRDNGKVVGAICAAPAVVLAGQGVLDGKNATCYPAPAFRDKIPNVAEGDVVRDGQLITATGPGTALKWSLEIVEALYDKAMADKLAGEMLAPR